MRPRPTIAGITLLVALLVALVAFITPGALALLPAPGPCDGTHWVGAWSAAPQSSSVGKPDTGASGIIDGRERTFRDQTLRMHVVPKIGGAGLRVHFGNRFGATDTVIGAATIARRGAGAAVVDGSVQPLTFDGRRSATVPAGGELVSDPVVGAVEPFVPLSVTFHLPGPAVVDYHQWATATNFLTAPGAGDHTGAPSGGAFVEPVTSVFGVRAVDVLAPRATGAIVTLGDSITDGVGSSTDLDRRWPDHLARRLQGLRPLSVVNAGIGGNHVATDGTVHPRAIGPSAVQRFATDVAAVAGVTDVIVFEGINDIGNGDPLTTAARVIDGYRAIISQARAAGLRVIGATITPARVAGSKETIRRDLNRWIRTGGEFDAVIDFDKAVRDPSDWSRVRPEHDAHFAHLNDAGYELLANAVDPGIFRGTGC